MKTIWKHPGKVNNIVYKNNFAILNSENCDIELIILADDLLQVKMLRPGEQVSDSIAIYKKDWPEIDFTVSEFNTHHVLETKKLKIEIELDPYQMKILTLDGELIFADFQEKGLGYSRDGGKVRATKTLSPAEKFYGLGERTGFLNKRGEYHELWNHDQSEPHVHSTNHLYKSIPFLLGLRGQLAYGLYFDNTFLTSYDLGKESEDYYYFEADGGALNYYICYGPTIKEVIARFTELTGRMELPPLWSLGLHQSKYSYYPEMKVYEVAEHFRQRKIPCDVIHLDIDYMDGYRIFTWDQERFPDPEQMIHDLKTDGFKTIAIVDPGVKVDYDYSIFQEAIEQRLFCTDSAGVPYIGEVWPGKSMFPDFSRKSVREWWAEKNSEFVKIGIDGLWNDMNEPANFATESKTLPLEIVHQNDGHLLTHQEYHNLYGLQMVMGTKKGLLQAQPELRPFILSRSGFAGIQRYAAVWTGDNQSYWEHLALSIPMLTTLGLSGISFAGSDIGGFSFDAQPELFARWIQLGSFYPFCRIHSGCFTRDQEPWSFGKEVEEIAKEYISLRYRLMPYIYNLFYRSSLSGLPIMRPMLLEFQDDQQTHNLNDQFMLGDSILIAPVIQPGKDCRTVYLPAGDWYDWHTNEKYQGGKSILADAPLNKMPIFVKSGSIIPLAPVVNYIGEKELDQITFVIYPGSQADYLFYEDDGQSFDYKAQKYNLTKIHAKFSTELVELTVTPEVNGYSSSLKSYQFVLKDQAEIREVKVNGISQKFTYDGADIILTIIAQHN